MMSTINLAGLVSYRSVSDVSGAFYILVTSAQMASMKFHRHDGVRYLHVRLVMAAIFVWTG
jgi:hypothetical protein